MCRGNGWGKCRPRPRVGVVSRGQIWAVAAPFVRLWAVVAGCGRHGTGGRGDMAGPAVPGATPDVGSAGGLFPPATAVLDVPPATTVLDAPGPAPDVPPGSRRPALPPALGSVQAAKTPFLAAPAGVSRTGRTRDTGRRGGKRGLSCSRGAGSPGKHRTPRGASFGRTAQPCLVEHAEAGPPPGDRHRPVVRGRNTREQLERVRPPPDSLRAQTRIHPVSHTSHVTPSLPDTQAR